MNKRPGWPCTTPTKAVKDIRRATCKHYSSEEKIRIVMDDLRGEHSNANLRNTFPPVYLRVLGGFY